MPSSSTDEPILQQSATGTRHDVVTSTQHSSHSNSPPSSGSPSPTFGRKFYASTTAAAATTTTATAKTPSSATGPRAAPHTTTGVSSSHPAFSSTGGISSSLRRSLSEQFNLIPEDRAVHITSVNRDGLTYQYRRESAKVIHPRVATAGSVRTVSLLASLVSFALLCIRLLLCWPLLVYYPLSRCVAFLFTAPITAKHNRGRAPNQQRRPARKQQPLVVRLAVRFVAVPALNIVKHIVHVLCTPAAERRRPKRTILLSGGSTIQSLHMARNFHAAGYRVVAVETEGRFALVAFSLAVSRYYALPAAVDDNQTAYVEALCAVAHAERPVLYVPVSAATAAQCDALAKPRLAQLGCETFVPGVRECAVLDDVAEVLLQCRRLGMAVPAHRYVRSVADVLGLHDAGWMRRHGAAGNRVLLHAIGLNARLNRVPTTTAMTTDGGRDADEEDEEGKEEDSRYLVLPRERSKVAAAVAGLVINEHRPWLVLAEPAGGETLHTCTTVRGSVLVANVTCRRDAEDGRLRPDDGAAGKAVDVWLSEFFGRIRMQRPIDGHFGFRLVQCSDERKVDGGVVIVPVGVRVGVPPAYMCHTGVQTRVLMPPCRHFSRQRSGPLVLDGDRYWVHEALVAALRNRAWLEALRRLVVESVLDGGEALFVYWDPLPGVAYAMWQVPRTCWRWWRYSAQMGNRKCTVLE